MSDHRNSGGWEPDPRQVGTNWQSMFDTRRAGQAAEQPPTPTAATESPLEDDEVRIDLTEYKPWIVQRVRSRPAIMLDLRRYEPRSGFWQSWAMPYHNLYAIEALGDRLLTLDFGVRQFVIEGRGLDELTRQLQLGVVLGIVEFDATLWLGTPPNAVVTSIRRAAADIKS